MYLGEGFSPKAIFITYTYTKMKKILWLLFVFTFFFIASSYAYNLTSRDKTTIQSLSEKIEESIANSSEEKRDVYISVLKKIIEKYKNKER